MTTHSVAKPQVGKSASRQVGKSASLQDDALNLRVIEELANQLCTEMGGTLDDAETLVSGPMPGEALTGGLPGGDADERSAGPGSPACGDAVPEVTASPARQTRQPGYYFMPGEAADERSAGRGSLTCGDAVPEVTASLAHQPRQPGYYFMPDGATTEEPGFYFIPDAAAAL